MTIRYRCGIECSDGGNIHTLRRVKGDERPEFRCLDCGMNVNTGEHDLGETTGEEIVR